MKCFSFRVRVIHHLNEKRCCAIDMGGERWKGAEEWLVTYGLLFNTNYYDLMEFVVVSEQIHVQWNTVQCLLYKKKYNSGIFHSILCYILVSKCLLILPLVAKIGLPLGKIFIWHQCGFIFILKITKENNLKSVEK